jgi:UDP-N-acetylglucosamine--N-acetylmuramyl-(pentapeptide) pyrophosphoryl-undecaprenol N-acetylglucosamine transferase
MKRILLVGGGSGGHFYPLIATAERLNSYRQQGIDLELYYMGPEPYDAQALSDNNIRFVSCPSGKQRKYFSLLNYLDIFKIFFGFFVAVYKLYMIYPDVIFSKGSYTSVPVTLAGYILRIPIVIHESDTKPGSANKLASRFARYIAISFDDAAKYFPAEKVALTGIPLRSIFYAQAQQPLAQLGLPQDKPLLFVTGGSLGAERLNNLILESLDELLPYYTILHQVGEVHEDNIQKTAASLITSVNLLEHYFVQGSLTGEEMNLALSAATLIISRAGAGSIFEIAHKGKPAIVIPIPETISHDQKTNAYSYARSGAASVIEEENFTDGLLASEISRIMSDRAVYESMSRAAAAFAQKDAASQIAQTVIGIAQEHG